MDIVSAEEKLRDGLLQELISQARIELIKLLQNDKESGKSWVAIPKGSSNRYLKVATLKRVLRDKFNHTLILESKIKHDDINRVIIEATLSHKNGGFLL